MLFYTHTKHRSEVRTRSPSTETIKLLEYKETRDLRAIFGYIWESHEMDAKRFNKINKDIAEIIPETQKGTMGQ